MEAHDKAFPQWDVMRLLHSHYSDLLQVTETGSIQMPLGPNASLFYYRKVLKATMAP